MSAQWPRAQPALAPAPKAKPMRSLPGTQEGGPGKAGGMISLLYP